ncbi:hypothetical protein [Rhizorhabdus histidinilytica]|uniref:hypothetical protein n=1 Tax=Rhizorhabdus histidinilytica TaxID=439228 RepID=UPI00321F9682
MYDITKQSVADTAAIHIKGADGNFLYADGKPVRIIIHSPGSAAFLEVDERATQRAIARMNENEGKVVLPPHAQRLLEQAEDLADITVAFENLAYPPAGEATGRALFVALYRDPKLGFIPPQITKATKDWGKFAPGTAGK